MSGDEFLFEIDSNLELAAHPPQLRALSRFVAERPETTHPWGNLQVTWSSDWSDLTLLAYFGQVLRLCQGRFARVNLQLDGPMAKKIPFLWQCGFFDCVRANRVGSLLECFPDPWHHRPDTKLIRANYTPLVTLDVAPVGQGDTEPQFKDRQVADCVNDWDASLRSTASFPVVRNADAVHSREYLYLLLWELVHNAYIHSDSHHITLAGQIFLSQEDITAFQNLSDPASSDYAPQTVGSVPALLDALSEQHRIEVQHTQLSTRRTWLKDHRDRSFLLLSCTDSGIGIPQSLKRSKVVAEQKTDGHALARAFSPWTSTRRNDPRLYDVHGLSQILRLVEEYDGYLYLQSGTAYLEFTRATPLSDGQPLPEEKALDGSLFQVLLPLSAEPAGRPVRKWMAPGRSPGSPEPADPEHRSVFVVGELRRAGIDVPVREEDWTRAADVVIRCADAITTDPVYLDLVRMPHDRQFLSFLLRSVRRTRLSHGVVVVNALGEFLAIAKKMQRIDLGAVTDEQVQSCAELDQDLALALSRGEIGCLPLLLPFLALADDGSPAGVLWLGLGCYSPTRRRVVEAALNHLLGSEGVAFSWKELLEIATAHDPVEDLTEQEFGLLFDAIVRCNRSLLDPVAGGCRSLLTPYHLEYASLASLRKEVANLIPQMEHQKARDQQDFLYSLAWHPPERRFRKLYYRTWPVLADEHYRHVCARLLVQQAYETLGDVVAAARAVVCATPSAGLLGREVAAILGTAFYEVPSIYEIEHRDWLPPLNGPAIVVDDVLDTGTLTQQLVQHLQKAGAHCPCVLTLLENEETVQERPSLPPVLEGGPIELGVPTTQEVTRAIESQSYFEVDPHTLDPLPPKTSARDSLSTETRRRLETLAHEKAIFSGHIVHGDHHYNIYFSLRDALASPTARDEILTWVLDEIRAFARQAQQQGAHAVTLIYPYYSPVYRLVSRVLARWYQEVAAGVELRCLVAKPCQLSGTRIGYQLADVTNRGTRDLEHAVFLDDGIASGGTVSAVLDGLVLRNARSVLALILFDRIGLQPRRHLRSIRTYRTPNGRSLSFSFRTFVSTNVRSHYDNNCPECLLARDILGRAHLHPGFLSTGAPTLESLLARTIVSSESVHIASRLRAEDVLSVLSFRHAVLSDMPSPQEIERSLAGRTGAPRLECLATVLSDPKLFRQITDREACERWMTEDIADPSVASDLRARFILHLGACADKSFARGYLTERLPQAYVRLAGQPEAKCDGSLNRYFNAHQREFLAVAAALYSLADRVGPDGEAPAAWLQGWKTALASDSERYTEANLYTFHLGTLFDAESELPVKEAEHLVANFAGSFSHHGDSFAVRLSRCRLAVNSQLTSVACEQMPPEMFSVLTDMVRRTQDHFKVWPFGKDERDEIKDAGARWQNDGDGTSLAKVISRHFLSETPAARPATIDRLLGHLAPRLGYLLGKAIADYRTRTRRPVNVHNEFESPISENSRVLGTSFYLWRVLSHLLDNAQEAWNRRRGGEGDDATPDLSVLIHVRPAPPHRLAVEVRDNVPCEDREIEEFFVPGSALATHRSEIEKWDGALWGDKLPNGWKRIVAELRTLDVERPLQDPEDENPQAASM